MGGNNSENNAAAGVAGLVFVGMMIFAAALFAVVAFITLIMSIVCLFAWNRPVTLFGETTEPHEARAFIKRGFVGVGVTWLFVVFCGLLFDVRIHEETVPYILIAGYCAGSLGLQILIERQKAEAAQGAALVPTVAPVMKHDPSPSPQAREEPFRFASWDEEIELNAPKDAARCRGCAWNDEGYRPRPGVSLR